MTSVAVYLRIRFAEVYPTVFPAVASVESPGADVAQRLLRCSMPEDSFVFHLFAIPFLHVAFIHIVQLIQSSVLDSFDLLKTKS